MDDSEQSMQLELSDLIQDGLGRSDDCVVNRFSSEKSECHAHTLDSDQVQALGERDGCLQEELASLKAALEEANRDKIKAAEYGLLALEEKHQLEQQLDELDGAHQTTRNELESTLQLLEELRSENSVRDKNEEALRLKLLQESEQRETMLLESAKGMELEVKRLQQALKRESERRQEVEERFQKVHFAELRTEQTEGTCQIKDQSKTSHQNQELIQQNEELRQQLQMSKMLQDKFLTLQQANAKLQDEKNKLSEDMELLVLSRQQLEEEALETAEKLRREHDTRLEIEGKLDELQLMNSSQLGMQSRSIFDEIDGGRLPNTHFEDDQEMNRSNMTPEPQQESLLSELQLCADDTSRVQINELEEALAEAEQAAEKAKKELAVLQKEHASLTKLFQEESERYTACLKKKTEECAQLNKQLNSTISLQGKVNTALKEQFEEEVDLLKKKNATLKDRVAELEHVAAKNALNIAQQDKLEKQVESLKKKEKDRQVAHEEMSTRLQDVLTKSSQDEELMKTVMQELKAVSSELDKIDRLAFSLTRSELNHTLLQGTNVKSGSDGSSVDNLLSTLHDQAKRIKSAMEVALQSSLKQVVATTHLSEPAERNLSDESKRQYHVQIQRLRQQLATKQQEVLTMRTVLQAQRSTSAAALERERTKADRQQRNTLQQVEQQEMEVKRLKKEIGETATFRSMFAGRCEEYISKLAEQEKKMRRLANENSNLEELLCRAVQQKVMLTERLEEFEIEREQSLSIIALRPTKI